MIERETMVNLPAETLWHLARCPSTLRLDPDVAESLVRDGWTVGHHATLTLAPGRAPRVHGHHRLCFLASTGRLSALVPVVVRV